MVNFYKLQGKMKSLLTGDIALESLEIAEDDYLLNPEKEKYDFPHRQDIDCVCSNGGTKSRDVPLGEDIKWMCGDCGATDWTPNKRRCKYCRED